NKMVRNITEVKDVNKLAQHVTTQNDLIQTTEGSVYIVTKKGYKLITDGANLEDIEPLKTDIESLKSEQKSLKSENTKLKNRVTDLETSNGEQATKITDLETTISDLETANSEQATKISDLETSNTDLIARIEALENPDTTT